MEKKCRYCYPRCEEGGCPQSHNEYGCMGCGCESPWGEGEAVGWCYCDICAPREDEE